MPLANNQLTPLRLLFFGDLMLDRHVEEKIKDKGLDYIFAKLETVKFFNNYDLISANLEGAVTNNGEHYDPQNIYDFAFHPDLIAKLFKLILNNYKEVYTQVYTSL
ncbi:MAG: CapA family protein [Patescibacteria group bacterium]|nr:CapA family protein [Patescibacteria group bacterium]